MELKQIKPERVFVKPNFVESNNQCILEKKRENQFVFAGRLDKLKGIDLLFEAWRVMGENAAKLVVCGTGPMENWCRMFIRENPVNIEMRGYLPNDKTLEIIKKSKALVLPTQWYEGFPMSIVEAFSVGTPVICSNIGNVGSIVEEGVTGYKFGYKAVDELVNAIRNVNVISAEKIKAVYESNYNESVNYEKLVKIYTNVAAKNNCN